MHCSMKRATEPPCLSALVDGTILSASQLGHLSDKSDIDLAGCALNVSQARCFLRRVSVSGLHPTQGVSELVSHRCEIGPGRG